MQHLVLGSASYSDATVRLQSFEAFAVSHSLHGKTRNQGLCRRDLEIDSSPDGATECVPLDGLRD